MAKKVESKKTRRVFLQDSASADSQNDDQATSHPKKQSTVLKGDEVEWEFFITAEDIKRKKPTKKYEFVEIAKTDEQQVSKVQEDDKDRTQLTVTAKDTEEVTVVKKEEQSNESLDSSGTKNDVSNTTSSRSEDDIFGEWVAAMLKNQKDQQKKSEIKKAIMNALLS